MSGEPAVECGRSPRFEFPIERGKIFEFARAIHSENPAFFGASALAPPTFLIVAGEIWGYSWERPGDSPLAETGVNASQALHLEETYEFYGEPLRAGDVLEGELCLFTPIEKVGRRSGRLTLHTTETTFWRPDGARAALARQVIAQLHDAARPEDPATDAAAGQPDPPVDRGDPGATGASTPECRRFGPLRLEDFVQYQAASGDLNPHHYDREVLTASGFSRFFSPGMLQAGFLGGQLADIYGSENIRRISVNFRELVYLGDVVTCRVSPPVPDAQTGAQTAEVELECVRSDGAVAITGSAVVDVAARAVTP